MIVYPSVHSSAGLAWKEIFPRRARTRCLNYMIPHYIPAPCVNAANALTCLHNSSSTHTGR